jgi:ABC-type Mn2+/Zn2+ transport system ATPase subunit
MPEFNVDRAQTHASMDRLEAWLLENDAILWIEHDLKLAQTLRLSPAVYQ